jgi:septum formation protein
MSSETSDNALILASASPRRKEILRSLGLTVRIIPAHINEDFLIGETPRQHVKRLSKSKAMLIARKHPDAWVLGADTIVVIDGDILGKPANKKQARAMLMKLSGREHKVFTGFTVIHLDLKISYTQVVPSAVLFKTISPQEMNWYISCDEPYDKAGGYAIQGKGASFIKAIRGSHTNVIGLPLCEVLETLKKLNAIHFR